MKILFKVAIAADEVSDRSRGVTALGRRSGSRLGDYHWVMNNHRFLTLWRNYDIANLSEVMMVGWVEGIELNFFGAVFSLPPVTIWTAGKSGPPGWMSTFKPAEL
jgi:hypothetical protein